MNRKRFASLAVLATLLVGIGTVAARELTEPTIVSKSRRGLANLRAANAAIAEFKKTTGQFPPGNSAEELVARFPAAKAAMDWDCTYVSDGIKAILHCPAYKGESFRFTNGYLSSYPEYLQGRLHPEVPAERPAPPVSAAPN